MHTPTHAHALSSLGLMSLAHHVGHKLSPTSASPFNCVCLSVADWACGQNYACLGCVLTRSLLTKSRSCTSNQVNMSIIYTSLSQLSTDRINGGSRPPPNHHHHLKRCGNGKLKPISHIDSNRSDTPVFCVHIPYLRPKGQIFPVFTELTKDISSNMKNYPFNHFIWPICWLKKTLSYVRHLYSLCIIKIKIYFGCNNDTEGNGKEMNSNSQPVPFPAAWFHGK